MKSRKRTLVKTVLLSLIRYERWKMNPKNIDKAIFMEQYKHSIGYTWIVLLLLTITSCAPVKKIEKSDVTQKLQAQTEVKTNDKVETKAENGQKINLKVDSSNVKKSVNAETKATEDITKTVNYDTSKQPDKSGKLPIASETTHIIRSVSNAESTQSQETYYSQAEVQQLFISYSQIQTHELDSLSRTITSLKSEVSVTTEQANNWWKWFLAGIGITAFCGFAWKFKWYKVFLPKI